jgi:uroporphyrinogen III methyltransferase/synthase
VDRTVREVRNYDWLILTSANGVTALGERLAALGLDARHLAGVKIAAIGRATADALRQLGLRADLVPTQFVAESLAAELIAREPMTGKRVLMLRADIARPALREKLVEAGAVVEDVSIYQTRPAAALPEEVLEALRDGKVNWITFTSSSTAKFFAELLGPERGLLAKLKIASIGPITSRTAKEIGLHVDVEAKQFDIAGLVTALTSAVKSGV